MRETLGEKGMRKHQLLIALFFLLLTTVVAATEPPQFRVVGEWAGPIKDTLIIKHADYAEGVVCYVYIPKNIGLTANCNTGRGCVTNFTGDIGSISCVNVTGNRKKK